MEDKVRFFKALGDETRLKIVKCLMKREYCACEFPDMTGKDQTTNSRHLKVLSEAGIIEPEKKGRYIIYSINDEIKKQLDIFGIKPSKCRRGKNGTGRC